jgi:hypothetical protein
MGPTEDRDFINSLRSTFSSFEVCCEITIYFSISICCYQIIRKKIENLW